MQCYSVSLLICEEELLDNTPRVLVATLCFEDNPHMSLPNLHGAMFQVLRGAYILPRVLFTSSCVLCTKHSSLRRPFWPFSGSKNLQVFVLYTILSGVRVAFHRLRSLRWSSHCSGLNVFSQSSRRSQNVVVVSFHRLCSRPSLVFCLVHACALLHV